MPLNSTFTEIKKHKKTTKSDEIDFDGCEITVCLAQKHIKH